jgi:hypothetical protein
MEPTVTLDLAVERRDECLPLGSNPINDRRFHSFRVISARPIHAFLDL